MSATRSDIPSNWLPERLATPGALTLGAGALAAFGVIALGLTMSGLAGLVGLADHLGAWLMLLPAVAAGMYLSWRHERFWIYTAVIAHLAMFMSQTNEGIGGGEIAFIGVALGGLCLWFFKEVVVHRRLVVRTGFDALLIATFLLTSIVALIANRLHDGELLRYFKEWTPMLDLLLYFPLRSMLKTRRDVYRMLTVLGILGVVIGVIGVATYRERLMTAVFAYQIEHSRVFANEPVNIIFAILGVVVVAYARTKWMYLLGALLTTSGMLFLFITFSRGSIVSAFVGIIVVMVFSGHGRRILLVLIASLVIGSGLVYMTYPTIAKTMATSVGRRLGTVGSTMTDVSFNLRVIEANTILRHYVPFSPLIGHGLGVTYHWYDPTEHATATTSFVHNGYVRLVFKYGYPLAVLFLFFLAYPLLRILLSWPSRRDPVLHALVIGCGAYLVTTLVNNYVSDMFSHYSGPLNFALCWAILDYVNRQTRPATVPTPESSTTLAAAGA